MDDLHPREVKAGSNRNAGAVDCVVLMRGEKKTPQYAYVSMPGYVYASHHFQRHGTVTGDGKDVETGKEKRKSDRNHHVGQLTEVEIRSSLPHSLWYLQITRQIRTPPSEAVGSRTAGHQVRPSWPCSGRSDGVFWSGCAVGF